MPDGRTGLIARLARRLPREIHERCWLPTAHELHADHVINGQDARPLTRPWRALVHHARLFAALIQCAAIAVAVARRQRVAHAYECSNAGAYSMLLQDFHFALRLL